MEINSFNVVLISLPFLLLTLHLLFHKLSIRTKRNLPPSPPSLPIIGHLHCLKHPIHRTLCKFSETYGPVFFLRLGSQPTVIVSSLEAAEECFTKNDVVLANRLQSMAGKYLGYDYTMMASAHYGDLWRNLRRISSIEIFSTHRLNILMGIRKDEVRRLLQKLSKAGSSSTGEFARIQIKSELLDLTFNIMMRMIAGKRYFGDGVADNEETRKFKDLTQELLRIGLEGNPGEFLPLLRWIDYGGATKRMIRLSEKIDEFAQGLIDEHRRKKLDGSEIKDTVLDHLLILQETEPDYCSDKIIKGFILVMLLAGTDSSSSEMEWALSYMVNHPNILDKARTEIDAQLGQDRLMDEADMEKLPYLQNIISETLRLKPAAPLLLPHRPSEDCRVGGYDVPRDSMVLVNAWAIHRDPKLWDDPETFKPERFEGRAGTGNRDPHKLIMPFGLGRRSCPGMPLAQRVMGLTLGSLIQSFDLKRVGEEPVDMAEGLGFTMPKDVPLELMCKVRPSMHELLL